MALEWLDTIMEKVFSIFPSLEIIDSTESGVAYWFGKPSLIKSEKLLLYWPIFCHIDVRKVVKQCIDCQTQAVLTKDGKSISIGVVVQYKINNPMKAFTDYDDLDTYIPPLAMSVAQEVICEFNMKNIIEDKSMIVEKLTNSLKKRLYNSGVEIINVFLNEISPCRVLRLITQTPALEEIE